MKASTAIAIGLGGALPALTLASPQSNAVPSDVSIPVYAAPTGMTVIPITFTAAFGTVPAGYVTYLTQPIQPLGPVYSTGTASATSSKTLTKGTSSKVSLATPIPTTAHHSSSSSSIEATSITPTDATSGVPASQETHTGAANAMMAAAGLSAGIAGFVGLALI